jgi:molybdenum cofactor synthesis domain-containing protein
VIPLEEALQTVLQGCTPLVPVSVPLDDALGRVAAAAVAAAGPVPPFANSAMDGYAVRSADVTGAPVTLAVAGTVTAGRVGEPLQPGQAIRIMTGAPVPDGADAVCMVEHTTTSPDGAEVVIEHAVSAGENVRAAGEDLAAGQPVLEAGTVLQPAHLGVLANAGAAAVLVHPRPRVGVLSTGDELVEAGGPLAPGSVYDANRHSLLAAVAAAGGDPVDLGVVPDDQDLLVEALRRAGDRCDLVLSSGGVSVGDLDVVRLVLERVADPLRWMQVAIKPAKPLAFGRLRPSGTPLLGLPGNPVSALVSFELFARPLLRCLAGHRPARPAPWRAVAGAPISRHPDGKTHFLRARLHVGADGRLIVTTVGSQGSHQLFATATANAVVAVPDGTGVPAGTVVDVLALSGTAAPAATGGDLSASGATASTSSPAGTGPPPTWSSAGTGAASAP